MLETELGGRQNAFLPTRWTLVLAARGSPQALDELIRAYWRPIYFFIRRKGHPVEDAKDLAQEFFASLLERNSIESADRARGKFRTFLISSLEHFLCDQHDRRHAAKRQPTFDFVQAEAQFRPEHTLERDWALAILERAFQRLRNEEPRLAHVAGVVRGEKIPYSVLAGQLQTTEGNVKVLVHRARKRLREMLLDELQSTVEPPADPEEELTELFRALSL